MQKQPFIFLGIHGARLSVAVAVLVFLGCKTPIAAEPQAIKTPDAAQSVLAASRVAKIVFVGKEHACDCTRKTIDATWASLQKAVGTFPKLPITRMQIDTEEAKVAPYRQQKPILALPALYFLDDQNTLIELLQGEVTEAQVKAVLQRESP